MTRNLFVGSLIFLGLVAASSSFVDVNALVTPAIPESSGVTAKAHAFLKSLDKDRFAKASFKLEDEQRYNWHFIPRGRLGVAMNEITPTQQDKVADLLKASLSEAGFERAEQVRMLEGILAKKEGRNRRFRRDPDLYYVSFFGTPGSRVWNYRFEGHHMSLNFTLRGDELVHATPMFFGSNPGEVQEGPHKGLRVLGDVEDNARKLVNSLTEAQLAKALGEGKPVEVESMQKRSYDGELPSGLPATELTEDQGELAKALVFAYTKSLKEEQREALHDKIRKSDFSKITFVWRGGRKAGEGHQYLLYGETFVISYANFQNGAKHVHALLRSRSGEFGPPK